MGLFGKEKLSEAEAAGQFVLAITKSVQQRWPEIANELTELLPEIGPVPDSPHASFEFALAVVATQIQALPNLLSDEQATRIREHVLQCLSSPDLGPHPREAIQQYQNAWDQPVHQGEPPFYGIASILLDKLSSQSTLELGGERFKDPVLLMYLSQKVVTFGGPWWKTITQKFELVSSTRPESTLAFRFGRWVRSRLS